MTAVSDYREFAPPADLSALVACVWRQDIGAGEDGFVQRILPDGCADVVWTTGRPVWVAGPDIGPSLAPLTSHSTTVGVRFRPGAAGAALGMPASEVVASAVSAEDVWGADLIPHLVPGERQDPLEALVAAVRPRLAGRRPDPLTMAAIELFSRRPELKVSEVAASLGISERHLRRRCIDAVGYGPKLLQRVLRLRRFLGALRSPQSGTDEASLAGMAAVAGYSDQAHLTNDCRRLSGLTPAALLAAWA